MPQIDWTRLHRFVSDTMQAAGLSSSEARFCADASIFADLRGAATHGVVYTVPRNLESMAAGKTISGSDPQLMRESGSSAFVRGMGVVGPRLAHWAMGYAITMAQKNGIGVVNTANGGPIGLLGYYANLAAERGMVGLVMANTAPAAAPFGGTRAVLGTNPFAYAAPARNSDPILFDVATTVVSAGKLARARRRGDTLPEGWLVDAGGKPVIEPQKASEGVMLPCGGHKGSGFSILIHLLTGALSASTVGGDETHNNPDPDKRGQSAFFMAVDPAAFGGRDAFLDLVERQIGFVHNSGDNRPLYPGERSWAEAAKRQLEGVPVDDADWKMIVGALDKFGLPVGRLTANL